jgi:3-hydroxyisobutyrate dehydrogenase-like beta-hydroxyacid dehydrogenase
MPSRALNRHDIGLIGFGEAGQTFVGGCATAPGRFGAFDIKTRAAATREAMLTRYRDAGVFGAETLDEALSEVGLVLSLVTADQALAAARDASAVLTKGALYCDCNSVSPETKRAAALAIEQAGGRYVDVAVMAPVHLRLDRVPLLLSGADSEEAAETLRAMGFTARAIEGPVGAASSVKMARSIMVKGMEALVAECFLSAYAAGVQDEVIASLDASWPGLDWAAKADYDLGRMLVHGRRRAAEMLEAAGMAADLGLGGAMAETTAGWQERIGRLAIDPPEGLRAKALAILAAEGRRP